jgi:hypothetical protein
MNNSKNILLINSNKFNINENYDNIIIISNNNPEINLNEKIKIIINENINSEINKLSLNYNFDYIEITSESYRELYIFILSIRRFCNDNTLIKINSNLIKNICNAFNNKIYVYSENNIFKFNSDYINNFINTKKPTIITAIFNLRKEENNTNYVERTIEKYIDWGKSYLLINTPIVIYTDEDLYDILKNIFIEKKNIKIIKKNIKEIYYYKYLNKLSELQKSFNIYNISIFKDTPLYVLLTNNRFEFIEDTIFNNYFNSDKFIWIDFGISKFAKNFEYINSWIKDLPNKIRQLLITPNIHDINNKETHRIIYHFIGAGLFSGDKEHLLKYSQLFKEKFEEILNNNWWQLDEAIMAIIYFNNPNLFNNYYGDYQNHIQNYSVPIFDETGIINMSINKYYNNNNKEIFKILNYVENYCMNSDDENFKLKYIYHSLICQFYENNKNFTTEFINLIKLNINDNIINLLKNNIHNINYYENKNEILQFIQ